ncbi:hypothetical protein [Chelatococcus sp. HY11]
MHRLFPNRSRAASWAVFGKEVSRDKIGHLRGLGLIALVIDKLRS